MDDQLVIAGYPADTLALHVGSVWVRLHVVRRLEDYVDTRALLADAGAPEPPYWAHLWTGARALARLVAGEIDCAGKRVIDIGCGLGLTAVVAARRGAAVCAFDLDAAAVEFTRANAALNDCAVAVQQGDVRTLRLKGSADYCFAADVTYDPVLQVAVADFLHRHLKPGGKAWCAESVRTVDTGFQRACAAHGLAVTEREVRELDEGRQVAVRITEVGVPMERPRLG